MKPSTTCGTALLTTGAAYSSNNDGVLAQRDGQQLLEKEALPRLHGKSSSSRGHHDHAWSMPQQLNYEYIDHYSATSPQYLIFTYLYTHGLQRRLHRFRVHALPAFTLCHGPRAAAHSDVPPLGVRLKLYAEQETSGQRALDLEDMVSDKTVLVRSANTIHASGHAIQPNRRAYVTACKDRGCVAKTPAQHGENIVL